MNYLVEENIFNYQGLFSFKDTMKTYPLGDGVEASLYAIAAFPKYSKLYKIEMYGQNLAFFINKNPIHVEDDVWNDRYNRIAIFVDNLQELHENGFINGVSMITKFEEDQIKYNNYLKQGLKPNENGEIEYAYNLIGGKKHILKKKRPLLDEYLIAEYGLFEEHEREEIKEEYFENLSDLVSIRSYIQLTEAGWSKYFEYANYIEFPKRISNITTPLLKIGQYETAVREVAVEIEDMIKKFHNTKKYGRKLIDYHINQCIRCNDDNYNAGIKVYATELKMNNDFVRNKYVHERVSADKNTHKALLIRQAYLFSLIEIAFKKILES